MADMPDNNSPQKRRQTDRSRLESWKAIANYVKRSVRTVRRWEASEEFPVHRHRHQKGFSVYAYEHEIDGWLISGRLSQRKVLVDQDRSSWRQLNSGRLVGYAVTSVIAVTVGVFAGLYFSATGPAPETKLDWQLSSTSSAAYWPESLARVIVSPVYLAWTEGRAVDAVDESRRIQQGLGRLKPRVRHYAVEYLFEILLALGRIDDARSLVESQPERVDKFDLQARLLFASSDKTALNSSQAPFAKSQNPTTVLILSLFGKADEVLRLAASKSLPATKLNVIHAIAALQSGDNIIAEERFERAVSELIIEDQGYYFVALDMLAGIHKRNGRLADAIAVLERTAMKSNSAAHNGSSLFWLMCQRQLAMLYREVDRDFDAAELENDLRSRLAVADPTFPLAVSIPGA